MAKLWGSRFDKATDALADKFTFSIAYDYRLAPYDVVGSIAHVEMLARCRIIGRKDAARIVAGLRKIGKQIADGTFKYDPKAEDIHTHIQNVLKTLVGPVADKLHTARSRNDQVVLDVKMYALDQLQQMYSLIGQLQMSVLTFAEKNRDVIFPAYTHLQGAQVVLLAHHMLAYIEMLERDKGRVADCFKRTNVMPLGSCALSGTSLPTKRETVTKTLGFAVTGANSMDAVSDRDFVIEALSVLAINAMHLSRFAEDLILWSTGEFNLVDIDGAYCTGSSIMPHKKNPDVLELIRGTSAKVAANLQEVLVLMKGLPLTYNRDMQLDKPPFFESVESVQDMLALLAGIFKSLKVKTGQAARRIADESFFSVDIMEYLIKKGVSYRDAHDTVGRMVRQCLDKGHRISDLSLSELKAFSRHFEADVKKLLNASTSVTIKQSYGSTNPKLVAAQLLQWRKILR